MRLFAPAWALLEDGLAVTLSDSLLRGYWADYMASERRGEPNAKHIQVHLFPIGLLINMRPDFAVIQPLQTHTYCVFTQHSISPVFKSRQSKFLNSEECSFFR